jgi:hypothetical protein
MLGDEVRLSSGALERAGAEAAAEALAEPLVGAGAIS